MVIEFGTHPYVDAVRVTRPQGGGTAVHTTRVGSCRARVGAVVGVVRVDVLPARPVAGGGRPRADLDQAVQFGSGVVPADADEGEVLQVVAVQALFGGLAEDAFPGAGW